MTSSHTWLISPSPDVKYSRHDVAKLVLWPFDLEQWSASARHFAKMLSRIENGNQTLSYCIHVMHKMLAVVDSSLFGPHQDVYTACSSFTFYLKNHYAISVRLNLADILQELCGWLALQELLTFWKIDEAQKGRLRSLWWQPKPVCFTRHQTRPEGQRKAWFPSKQTIMAANAILRTPIPSDNKHWLINL